MSTHTDTTNQQSTSKQAAGPSRPRRWVLAVCAAVAVAAALERQAAEPG